MTANSRPVRGTRPAAVGATRDRIRSAAIDLFQRRGLSGLSMRSIAREVGISATALYRHYPSRDAIVQDVWREGYTELAAIMSAPIDQAAAEDRILELLDRYVAWALRQPGIHDLKYRHDPTAKDLLPRDADVGALADVPVRVHVGELEAGVARGELAPLDVWSLATAVWSLGHGLVDLMRAGQIDVPAAERRTVARDAMRLLLAGMRAGREESVS